MENIDFDNMIPVEDEVVSSENNNTVNNSIEESHTVDNNSSTTDYSSEINFNDMTPVEDTIAKPVDLTITELTMQSQERLTKRYSSKMRKLEELINTATTPEESEKYEIQQDKLGTDYVAKMKKMNEDHDYIKTIDNYKNAARGGASVVMGAAKLADRALVGLGIKEDEYPELTEAIKDNESKINKYLKENNIERGSLQDSSAWGRVLTEVLPVAHLSKLRYIVGADVFTGISGDIGEGKSDEEALKTGGERLLFGTAIGTAGKVYSHISGGKLLDNLVEAVGADTKQLDEVYANYKNMHGIDTLTNNDKVRAISFAIPEAKSYLYNSLSGLDKTTQSSSFHQHFKKVSDDITSKFKDKDILLTSKDIRKANDEVAGIWKDFNSVLDLHHGDQFISVSNRGREAINEVMAYAGNSKTVTSLREQLSSGKMNIASLAKIKQIAGDLAFGIKVDGLKIKEQMNVKDFKDLYSAVNKELKTKMPDDMKDLFGMANKAYSEVANANEKKLVSFFNKEKDNIKNADVSILSKEALSKGKNSSFNSLMKTLGKDSKAAGDVELLIVKDILNSNSKDGLIEFNKIVENIDELNFKTSAGKAVKKVLSDYSSVFKNVTKESNVGGIAPKTEGSLTLNPVMAEAFKAQSKIRQYIGSMLGLTQTQRGIYVLNKLPDVVSSGKMPTAFSLIEQRGVIAYAKEKKHLKKLASINPEELEAGKDGYATSQMIGEAGMSKIDKEFDIEDVVTVFKEENLRSDKTWEKTQWYSDTKDGMWKFHLANKDARVTVSKGKIIRGGDYDLNEVMKMPELFKAYPELEGYRVVFKHQKNAADLGSFSPSTKEIIINTNGSTLSNGKMIHEVKKTLVHEIQHAIQGIEGFAKGGNPDMFKGVSKEEANRMYRDLHGEVEARRLTTGEVGTYPKFLYERED